MWPVPSSEISLKEALLRRKCCRGGARNIPTGGLSLSTRGLKCDKQGTIASKNFRKKSFSHSEGGLEFSDEETIAISPPLAPLLLCWYAARELSDLFLEIFNSGSVFATFDFYYNSNHHHHHMFYN